MTTITLSYTENNAFVKNMLRTLKKIKITISLFAMLLFVSAAIAQNSDCNQIVIGNGTELSHEIPINTLYHHSYSQQIYEASEMDNLPIDSPIYSVSFYKVGSCDYIKPNQSIYIGNTNKTNFSNTSDWVPISELIQVYSGSFT
ncbi:MAG: hypothetical protein LBU83_03175, partial [Bacteroidales bacterium]|nr:hypothetical protein [Bacteroidales bacterium]